MSLVRALLPRIARALFVVWAAATLAFFVNQLLPGDPARMVAGPQAMPAEVARIRAQLGMERPAIVQYTRFLRRLVHVTLAPTEAAHGSCAAFGPLHVDLGHSYVHRRPVLTVIGERLPRSLLLAFCAVSVQVALGVGAGIVAAVRRGRPADHVAVTLSLLGTSAPTFLLGLLLQFVLAHKLSLLPLDGFGKTPLEHLRSVILPALTLGIFGAAYYTRLARDELVGLLAQPFIRTARAKGLGEARVVLVHALRGALGPLVTVIGLDLGGLVGGAIVTESLFRWPGIGELSTKAILDRDGPLVMGTVIVSAAMIALASLAVDVAYLWLDPRMRANARG